jgi:serine/threonine protein kinase
MLGTRGYLSPEQARGEPLTRAADWFSFGVTLSEAANGRMPFEIPFVSAERTEEAKAFSQALDTVKRGQSAILHPHGDPGVGKSELARHFMDEAQNRGALKDLFMRLGHRKRWWCGSTTWNEVTAKAASC